MGNYQTYLKTALSFLFLDVRFWIVMLGPLVYGPSLRFAIGEVPDPNSSPCIVPKGNTYPWSINKRSMHHNSDLLHVLGCWCACQLQKHGGAVGLSYFNYLPLKQCEDKSSSKCFRIFSFSFFTFFFFTFFSLTGSNIILWTSLKNLQCGVPLSMRKATM